MTDTLGRLLTRISRLMCLNLRTSHQNRFLKTKYLFLVVFYQLCIISQSAALDINFIELGKQRPLTNDALHLFKQILPEADTLNLNILMEKDKKIAVMTVLLNQKTEDGFTVIRDIPYVNSYTYLVAWLLQSHFNFLQSTANTPRQKKHKRLLGRYFDGKSINGPDIFYLGKRMELFYEPPTPKVRGIGLFGEKVDKTLYSGYPKATGFGKIIIPGFKTKYIAVFSDKIQTYASE